MHLLPCGVIGSTTGFDPVSPGSNPGGVANKVINKLLDRVISRFLRTKSNKKGTDLRR